MLYIKESTQFTKEISSLVGKYFLITHMTTKDKALLTLDKLQNLSLIVVDQECTSMQLMQKLLELQESYKYTLLIYDQERQQLETIGFSKDRKSKVYRVKKPQTYQEHKQILTALYPNLLQRVWSKRGSL